MSTTEILTTTNNNNTDWTQSATDSTSETKNSVTHINNNHSSNNNDNNSSNSNDASGPHRYVTLRNGYKMPCYVYGTYKIGALPTNSTRKATVGRSTRDVILDALKVGYRNFDCAGNYENEKGIGDAIRESGIPRSELFLSSKLRQGVVYEGASAVRASVEQTLKDLGTDYMDMFYIHWPVPADDSSKIPRHIVSYQEMENLHREKKIRSLGISNYTIKDYCDLKAHMKVAPVVNQFEVSVFMYRKNTIKYFEDNGLKIVGYRALTQGDELNNKILNDIAAKHNVSVPQVMLRWCVEHGVSFVARSENVKHMISNTNLEHFALDSDDLSVLDNLTSPDSIEMFKKKYEDCILRETPWHGGKPSDTGFVGWATGPDDKNKHIAN